MRDITKDPRWTNHLNQLELELAQAVFQTMGRDVILFQCECCDKWSAFAESMKEILLPISEDSKDECIKWLKENEFTPIGEYVNEAVQYYN